MFEIANRSEADRVLNGMTLGFVADPFMRWLYPEPSEYLSYFPRVLDLYAGRAFDNGSAYRNDGFTAAALWLPPDIHPDEDALAAYMEDTVAPDKHAALFAAFELMDRFHPAEPCWHLADIAIDPSHQGRGLGTALLTTCLDRCDDDGRPAYLESTNAANLSIYRRFGFEQIGVIETDQAPPLFPMLRRPVKAATSSRD
jgi:ribosomal protein S18 acetylase RimI-like enzyme